MQVGKPKIDYPRARPDWTPHREFAHDRNASSYLTKVLQRAWAVPPESEAALHGQISRRNRSMRQVSVHKVMFETDLPHLIWLYPELVEHIAAGLAQQGKETDRRMLSENAAKLHSIALN